MSDFIAFIQEPIAQRALLACLIIGFANGFVSGLIVLKKSALQLGTLSCALLPGIAIAILIFGFGQWSLLLGAVVAAMFVGLSSIFVSRTSRVHQDTALSVIHTTAFATGYIVLIKMGLQQKIDDWLFGSIMSMSDLDIWFAYGIGFVTVVAIIAYWRPLMILLFDAEAAISLGIPTRALNYAAFALIILVLVSSLQAVGAFLTLGLMVAPAASVRLISNSTHDLFWGGGMLGASGAVLAFFISYPLGWHLGATIILVLGVMFLLAYLYAWGQRRKNSGG